MMKYLLCAALITSVVTLPTLAQEPGMKVLPAGAKVFIAPMENGFQDYLKAAFQAKKIPLLVVDDKNLADFEISGHSDTQKASTAKKVFLWDWRSNEQAGIQITNLKTSEVIFAYAVNKVSSSHGKKSTAEACAKHIKEKIESKQ